MAKTATVTIRIDPTIKLAAGDLYAHYGMSLTDAISVFIHHSLNVRGLPFDLRPVAPLQLGLYRHFKGGRYEVIGFAKHSETLEDMVIYKALYGEQKIWVRPLSMWENLVEVDGKAVKRFECIGEAETVRE